MSLREVYVPIENEVIDGVPVPMIEFREFWKTHTSDDGFIMAIVNDKNQTIE